jgi:uncharacterized membrane protein (DUF106 family)
MRELTTADIVIAIGVVLVVIACIVAAILGFVNKTEINAERYQKLRLYAQEYPVLKETMRVCLNDGYINEFEWQEIGSKYISCVKEEYKK